jgi:hypothetical protein
VKRKIVRQIDEFIRARNDLKRIIIDYEKEKEVSQNLKHDLHELVKSYEARILETLTGE